MHQKIQDRELRKANIYTRWDEGKVITGQIAQEGRYLQDVVKLKGKSLQDG